MELTASQVAQIQEIQINPSENFLMGTATSGFAGVAQSSLGVASGAASLAGGAIQSAALMADISAAFIEDIQKQVMDAVAAATIRIMTIPLAKFAEAMNKEISDKTFSAKDIIEKLTKGAEEVAKSIQEGIEIGMKAEITSKANEKINKITGIVTETLNKAKAGIDTITAYITQGPAWVQQKLDDFSYATVTQAMQAINKTAESFETEKNVWAESAGKAAAQKVVNPINDKLVKAQANLLNKIEDNKEKAKTVAKAAAAQAIMKIKGLLGG